MTTTSTTSASTNWRGPCSGAEQAAARDAPHVSWDLDIGESVSWWRAVQMCSDCPVRELCTQMRAEMFPTGNPSGVIWAGVAYSETGRVLDQAGLRRLGSTRRNRVNRGRPRSAVAA